MLRVAVPLRLRRAAVRLAVVGASGRTYMHEATPSAVPSTVDYQIDGDLMSAVVCNEENYRLSGRHMCILLAHLSYFFSYLYVYERASYGHITSAEKADFGDGVYA